MSKRKFDIPTKSHKRAYPKARYLGTLVNVKGIDRVDERQRTYYLVSDASKRTNDVKAVRSDKLIAV